MKLLREKWQNLASKFSNNEHLIDQFWLELETAYQGRKRFYHDLVHIPTMLDLAEKHREQIRDFEVLQFSIFYHDAIYDVKRQDNELKSAELAKDRMQKLGVSAEKNQSVF